MNTGSRPQGSVRRRAQRVFEFVKRDIWLLEVTALPRLHAFLTRLARVLLIAVRGFFRDRCLQQAAALTYITIFSLPSMLAFAFAAAKGFNLYEAEDAGDRAVPRLDSASAPRARRRAAAGRRPHLPPHRGPPTSPPSGCRLRLHGLLGDQAAGLQVEAR
jgi:hypothetical protein